MTRATTDRALALSPETVTPHRALRGLRWYVCGLLFLVTCLNYVDRVTLGVIKDDVLKAKFGWTEADFGWTVFSLHLAFALGFVVAGRLLDRFGVRAGLAIGAVIWSLAAMGHAFAATVLGFAVARFVMGLGESTNFPAAVKAVAEWFPRRERALATGIFNTGSGVGAMLQGPILILALSPLGWQFVFVAFGLLGFVWLAAWLALYRPLDGHPRLSEEEKALIRSDPEPEVQALQIPWPSLLRYREAWAFSLGKMLTDPVWWFFLYWAPGYLKGQVHDRTAVAWGLALVYLGADAGSILGGWIAGRLQKAGWTASRARLTTMLGFACLMPASLLLNTGPRTAVTVLLLGLVTGAHQGWSANMFTVASDAFPKRAVGSVVGFGAMCGAIGGMFMPLIAGAVLVWRQGDFGLLFVLAGVMHPLTWLVIRLLTGRRIQQVDLDRGLRTAFSPGLLAAGVVTLLAGITGTALVVRNWTAVVSTNTDGTQSAAAMVVTACVMVAFIGAAFLYASREQKPTMA